MLNRMVPNPLPLKSGGRLSFGTMPNRMVPNL
jgi:hypothetical protein